MRGLGGARRWAFSRRMAAAACGPRASASNGGRGQQQQQRRRGDSRRRQAALSFLSNISLDGRPLGGTPRPPLVDNKGPLSPGPPNGPPALLLLAKEPGGACALRNEVGLEAAWLNGLYQTPPPPPLVAPSPGFLLPQCSSSSFTLELPKQRTKHLSGSPRHRSLKKIHFIKNMRQYDTRNSRIVLICAKRSLCAAFSILPYGDSLQINDSKVEGQKQRHPSGGVPTLAEMVLGLEGAEPGADGEVVSYSRFLYPTNALMCPRNDHPVSAQHSRCSGVDSSKWSHRGTRIAAVPSGAELGSEAGETIEYNPNLLDDPQWPCGKHKRVLIFASYMTTVIEYVKPSDLKKDMNETFKEKLPHIKLTLSKIRSLKREMRNVAVECGLEPVTVAMSYVYFEKLVLQGKLNKQNRKLCAGACVLLAAKISSDLRKHDVKHLLDKLEERFRFNRRDLIGFELKVLVALELALYLPENQVLPHYRRLAQQT
ncbi:CDK5 and ABL1 enzyme substrate 2 [Rhinatrema bivittatum]|uniref:CDK5 and ABL1 enzyme substrate 2 n=1 Tax=Rhinatrema bivittatum TaxID=194408 RepID=UPI0011266F23|nr:CDK5 and ABL1 enzyme substrate 2 [Rhinatrema bivittatum]